MSSPDARSSERRWIVLSEDGRFVTLGRASDLTEQEILDAEVGLLRQGLAGWLAVMQRNPYVGATPRLMEVRALGTPTGAFEKAAEICVEAIMRRRQEAEG
jgi:hypothetical protein